MLVIGIVEDKGDRTTYNLLKNLLIAEDYSIIYETKVESLAMLKNKEKEIMILDIKPSMINSIEDFAIDFNIIIHTFVDINNDNKEILKRVFKKSNYIILNCDEEKWINLIEENLQSIVITYGFNNKASINLSSYNNQDLIEANICFQRGISKLNGNIIEPFELPIKLNSRKKSDIYSAIAVIACGLIIEIDIFSLNLMKIFNSTDIIRI